MNRRQREEARRTPSLRAAVAVTAALSVVATAIAIGALALATRGPAPSTCATVAWKALPDAGTLPAGWSLVSDRVFVDTLTVTIAGPTPTDSSQRPAVFASLSCYGDDAALALRRAHEGALAAGGADAATTTLGDESFLVRSSTDSTTTLYFRRGALVADLTAPTTVDPTILDTIAQTLDTAMARSLAVSADASPVAQPSRVAQASPSPSSGSSPAGASPGASPSASPAPESHEAPDLEKLLPRQVRAATISTQSALGSTALGSSTASQALIASLQQLGKAPADLQVAGGYDASGTLDLTLFAYRASGVDATELMKAVVKSQLTNTAAKPTSSPVVVAGHATTKISYAQGPPVYVYVFKGVVFAIQTSDASLAATVLDLLK